MTFREALEREINTQGISVAEVAEKSRVSKGTIYNILNGTTEEARIRTATRRALARGCNRDLKILSDGGVMFVIPNQPVAEPEKIESVADVAITLVPFRPFLSHSYFREPFDWLFEQEERGRLPGLQTVDRVFQRRNDFLAIELFNFGNQVISDVQFDLKVTFHSGPVAKIACRLDRSIPPGERLEQTLFLLAGPAYMLSLDEAVCCDVEGQFLGIAAIPTYRFEGDIR
jgi:transcriptional regulator with XRE-family HTH domain